MVTITGIKQQSEQYRIDRLKPTYCLDLIDAWQQLQYYMIKNYYGIWYLKYELAKNLFTDRLQQFTYPKTIIDYAKNLNWHKVVNEECPYLDKLLERYRTKITINATWLKTVYDDVQKEVASFILFFPEYRFHTCESFNKHDLTRLSQTIPLLRSFTCYQYDEY